MWLVGKQWGRMEEEEEGWLAAWLEAITQGRGDVTLYGRRHQFGFLLMATLTDDNHCDLGGGVVAVLSCPVLSCPVPFSV